jgi:hypothetical protein
MLLQANVGDGSAERQGWFFDVRSISTLRTEGRAKEVRHFTVAAKIYNGWGWPKRMAGKQYTRSPDASE